jgi:ABC-type multidrug transport system ATPase subunit
MIEICIEEGGYDKNRPIINDIHFSIKNGEMIG